MHKFRKLNRSPRARENHTTRHAFQRPTRSSSTLTLFALALSLVSAGAAAWQTFLIRDQLTAGDRNRGFEGLVQQAGAICELFYPNKIKSYSYAAQEDGTSIIAVAIEDIDPSIWNRELAEKVATEARKLRQAFTVANIWSADDQAEKISRARDIVMDMFQYFNSADLSISYYRDFFAMRYVNASHACTNDRGMTLGAGIAGLINGTSDWWIQPGLKPNQIIVAPKANLERMNLEEIRQLAKQQAELLKGYDSYNQI